MGEATITYYHEPAFIPVQDTTIWISIPNKFQEGSYLIFTPKKNFQISHYNCNFVVTCIHNERKEKKRKEKNSSPARV